MSEDLYVEVFPPFTDLPEFSFSGEEILIRSNADIQVNMQEAGHYAIYKLRYTQLPESHPDGTSYIIYDIDALTQKNRKVYKIFNRNMLEMTLGEATYDLGLLFSEGRVYSDTHFLARIGL